MEMVKKARKLHPKQIIELDKRLRRIANSLEERESRLNKKGEKIREMERNVQELGQRVARREIMVKEKEALLKMIRDYREAKKVRGKRKGRYSTGIPRLDDLTLGGFPFGSNVLVYMPRFTGGELLIWRFVVDGLDNDIPCFVVTAEQRTVEIRDTFADLSPLYKEKEGDGLIWFLDLYTGGKKLYRRDENVEYVDKLIDLDVVKLYIDKVLGYLSDKGERYKMVLPLSKLLSTFDISDVYEFVERICQECKKRQSVVLYPLFKGMVKETDVEKIVHLMDGVIEFKGEGLKRYLRIRGLCDTVTRSWIQYRSTDKELELGSFFLEHIR